MDTYLTIMVTILVITQIIRITQNTIQLHRQSNLIKKQLSQIEDITQQDLDNQRKAYQFAIKYFESRINTSDMEGEKVNESSSL